eukprot:CAMPEP_0118649752 /NCGR_PEP_ID=MMETSP0785-20121206/9874_1 /TAXON_ID=91992 /ORGANISM="Bolidomonas pacifica, Strain CCMP 1866" /LENGTH=154 /DNA_ID=CAMNT_0006542067 /DNA_START=79 /DNA_END=540 /DNA_ORIENTATION=+
MVFGWGKKKKKKKNEAAPPADPNAPAPLPPFEPDALPGKQDVANLEKKLVFTKQELNKLKTRYQSLVDKETGRVDKDSFCSQPELACCATFVKLSMDKEFKNVQWGDPGGEEDPNLPKNRSQHQLSFDKFVSLLSLLSPKTGENEKYDYLFDSL